MIETLEAMRTKHLKTLQAVLHRALEGLRAMPLSTGMEAVRAIEMVIRQERLVRGEGKDGGEDSMEAIIRREYERWMIRGKTDSDEKET